MIDFLFTGFWDADRIAFSFIATTFTLVMLYLTRNHRYPNGSYLRGIIVIAIGWVLCLVLTTLIVHVVWPVSQGFVQGLMAL